MTSPSSPCATVSPELAIVLSESESQPQAYINSLYPDLLERVFVLCVHWSPNVTSPTVLDQVCRYWRDVTQQAGRLWTHIDLAVPGKGFYFLQRSHDSDLHVKAHTWRRDYDELRRVWQALPKERVVSLTLDTFFWDELLCDKAPRVTFEKLSTLVLFSMNFASLYSGWSYSLHELKVWHDFQKLEVLALHKLNITAARVLTAISSLHLLKFVFITTDLMKGQPVNYWSDDAEEVPAVSLPHLRCFKAGPVSKEAMMFYMEKVKLPPSGVLYLQLYRGERTAVEPPRVPFSHLVFNRNRMYLDTMSHARRAQTYRTIIEAYSNTWAPPPAPSHEIDPLLRFDTSHVKQLELGWLEDPEPVWSRLSAASFPNVTALVMDNTSPRWKLPLTGFPLLEHLNFSRCDLLSWDKYRSWRAGCTDEDELASPTAPGGTLVRFLRKRNAYCSEKGLKNISHTSFHGCWFQPGAPELDTIAQAGFCVNSKDSYAPSSLEILQGYFYDTRRDWQYIEEMWSEIQWALSLSDGVDGGIDEL